MSLQLFHNDCLVALAPMAAGSVDLVVTDPPYAFHKMGQDWRASDDRPVTKSQTVKNLSVGMAFRAAQAAEAGAGFEPFAKAFARVMRRGSFAIVFAAPRLSHGFCGALESAGLAIRDCLVWRHDSGQFKAASLRHYGIEGDYRVPQPRPVFETMILAQKISDKEKLTALWRTNRVGLMKPKTLKGFAPSNIFDYPKPSDAERKKGGSHPTQKPVGLLEDLIHCFSNGGQTVLDPFMGSGSAGVAAVRRARSFIGVEADRSYFESASSWIASERF